MSFSKGLFAAVAVASIVSCYVVLNAHSGNNYVRPRSSPQEAAHLAQTSRPVVPLPIAKPMAAFWMPHLSYVAVLTELDVQIDISSIDGCVIGESSFPVRSVAPLLLNPWTLKENPHSTTHLPYTVYCDVDTDSRLHSVMPTTSASDGVQSIAPTRDAVGATSTSSSSSSSSTTTTTRSAGSLLVRLSIAITPAGVSSAELSDADRATLPHHMTTAATVERVPDLEHRAPASVGGDRASRVAVCVATIDHNVDSGHVQSWLEHLGVMGASHAFVYHTPDFLEAATEAGTSMAIGDIGVTLVDWTHSGAHTFYRSQHLALQDCLYRAKGHFDSVLVIDTDEWLVVESGKLGSTSSSTVSSSGAKPLEALAEQCNTCCSISRMLAFRGCEEEELLARSTAVANSPQAVINGEGYYLLDQFPPKALINLHKFPKVVVESTVHSCALQMNQGHHPSDGDGGANDATIAPTDWSPLHQVMPKQEVFLAHFREGIHNPFSCESLSGMAASSAEDEQLRRNLEEQIKGDNTPCQYGTALLPGGKPAADDGDAKGPPGGPKGGDDKGPPGRNGDDKAGGSPPGGKPDGKVDTTGGAGSPPDGKPGGKVDTIGGSGGGESKPGPGSVGVGGSKPDSSNGSGDSKPGAGSVGRKPDDIGKAGPGSVGGGDSKPGSSSAIGKSTDVGKSDAGPAGGDKSGGKKRRLRSPEDSA